MAFAEALLLSLALAADAFTVGAAVALRHSGTRRAFRIVFHFGLFQSLFATLGALLGTAVLALIRSWDHWLVFAVLAFLGARMIWESIREDGMERHVPADLTKGWAMVGLSTAVSIDALGAGVGLPAITSAPVPVILLIGVVTALATLAAWRVARRVGPRFHTVTGVVAGLVLIGLGVDALLTL